MNESNTRQAGSLIVFSWGSPHRLGAMIRRLGPLPERVVLIDPVPGETLPEILRDQRNMIVIRATPSTGAEGRTRLTSYSLPGLHSRTPTTNAFAALFPGLEQTGEPTVEQIAPEAMARRLLDLPRPLHLVIDTPGAEHDVLAAVDAAGLMHDVRRISLRCGFEPFFEGAEGVSALQKRLEPDFRLLHKDITDPDWPECLFETDINSRRIAKLKEALSKHEAEAANLRGQIDKQAKELVQTRTTIDKLTNERDKARTDLGIAVRVQALLQADLNDLREKYSRAEDVLTRQEHLLQKLTPRLQEAACQLRDMQAIGSPQTPPERELTHDAAIQEPKRASAPHKGKPKGKSRGKVGP